MSSKYQRSLINLITTICAFTIFLTSNGQNLRKSDTSVDKNLILTCPSNSKWLDSLKQLTLPEQILTIKKRAILDTNVYTVHPLPDGLHHNDNVFKNKQKGCCKPLYSFGGYLFSINDRNPREDLIAFMEILGKAKIVRIEVLNGGSNKDLAIYGTNGSCGVVILEIKDKQSLKMIKKLEKQQTSYTLKSDPNKSSIAHGH